MRQAPRVQGHLALGAHCEHMEGDTPPPEIQFLKRIGNIRRSGWKEEREELKRGKKINKIKLHYFLYLWKKTI